MKKFTNNPDDVVDEMLERYLGVHSKYARKLDTARTVVRKGAPVAGKVGVITGGGSGHKPAFKMITGSNFDMVITDRVMSPVGGIDVLNKSKLSKKSRSRKKSVILMVNPSIGKMTYGRADKFRGYLSLGTLASALGDSAFIRAFALKTGKKQFISIVEEVDLPLEVRIINLSLKPQGLTIKDFIGTFITENGLSPIVIGSTATSAQLTEAAEVAAAAKVVAPLALRVIGGPHVSVLTVEYLTSTDYQVACIGEGVETLTEIVLEMLQSVSLDFSKIQGIGFKDTRGKIHFTQKRKPFFTLDAYPYPSKSLGIFVDDLDDFKKNGDEIVYVYAGLGCPFDCAFCSQRAIHNGSIRERSADSVFAEIKTLHEKGFRKFAIVQETFFSRKSRVDRFCKLVEHSGLKLEWTAETRADQVDYRGLIKMRNAGLRMVQIGVESGDQAILDTVRKGINLEQIIEVIEWCRELRVNTSLYILVGLPGQGWQSIYRTARLIRDHMPYNRGSMHVSVSVAIPYPGTKLAMYGTIRLLTPDTDTLDWPRRNPGVMVNDMGEFMGENHTETDDMTSQEIFESMLYLDDFGTFRLHAQYNSTLDDDDRERAYDFSNRIFYMVERRAIRDLIIRAQPGLTPEKRKKAYMAIREKDHWEEEHFKVVTRFTGTYNSTFSDFISSTSFVNGFDTMICLSIANRLKWMKLCAAVWALIGKNDYSFRFEKDDRAFGERLNLWFGKLDTERLNNILDNLSHYAGSLESCEDLITSSVGISAFGLDFESIEKEKILEIRAHGRPDSQKGRKEDEREKAFEKLEIHPYL